MNTSKINSWVRTFFGRCLRCGGLLYEDGFCPKCRK
jgi:hypothetical protein